MKAAIIAVGSELLGPTRVDTNSLHLTRVLERNGVGLVRKSIVGDDENEIVRELRVAFETCSLVLVTGGLGPTEDDLTREAVARAFGLVLEEDRDLLHVLEKKFSSRGVMMPGVNARQALVFAGQRTLPNPRGTAPGFHIEIDESGEARHIWIFPGVPWEMEGMVEADLEPWLRATHPSRGRYRRVVKITGMAESAAEEKLAPFYDSHRGEEPLTILATSYEIQLHLHVDGEEAEANRRLREMEKEIREIFGDRVYGTDDELLESVVGRLLASRGETVATAESCTGGLVGSRITDVSGSSGYFLGGVVAYTRDAKTDLLGVDPKAIDEHGEVSEDVARQMAEGVRKRFGATYGIGTTGIAGPTGGTEEKPVGTVHIVVAGPGETKHRVYQLPPPRERVKNLTAQAALDLLRRMALK